MIKSNYKVEKTIFFNFLHSEEMFLFIQIAPLPHTYFFIAEIIIHFFEPNKVK